MTNTHDGNEDRSGMRAVSSQGGSGKTTTAFALALHLAASKGSFLIDNDNPHNEKEKE